MNITYKRINKSTGNYDVLLDEKNVGSIIGKAKNWELNNLFGASISNGTTRDLAVKYALENLWEYELEFELFHSPESNQEKNEVAPEITLKDKYETIKITEENNLLYAEPNLGDDYQPMEKEPISSKCDRVVKNFLAKIKEYANKIGIY